MNRYKSSWEGTNIPPDEMDPVTVSIDEIERGQRVNIEVRHEDGTVKNFHIYTIPLLETIEPPLPL